MRISKLVGRVAALAVLAGCSESLPETPALPAPPEIADAGTAIEMAAVSLDEPPVCEDTDPAAPAALVVAAAPSAPTSPKPTAAARPRVETTDPAPAETHFPLDALLRVPPGSRQAPLDLRELEDKPVAAGPPTSGVLDEWKERVRVERHTEATGHAGPNQGSVTQTDAGVRIPVDKSVSLEGGVRVDQHDDPKAEEAQRKSIPRVGVEVRF